MRRSKSSPSSSRAPSKRSCAPIPIIGTGCTAAGKRSPRRSFADDFPKRFIFVAQALASRLRKPSIAMSIHSASLMRMMTLLSWMALLTSRMLRRIARAAGVGPVPERPAAAQETASTAAATKAPGRVLSLVPPLPKLAPRMSLLPAAAAGAANDSVECDNVVALRPASTSGTSSSEAAAITHLRSQRSERFRRRAGATSLFARRVPPRAPRAPAAISARRLIFHIGISRNFQSHRAGSLLRSRAAPHSARSPEAPPRPPAESTRSPAQPPLPRRAARPHRGQTSRRPRAARSREAPRRRLWLRDGCPRPSRRIF